MTMSRVDVDGEPGDVCVLMWLVVYSRAVVYATELESARRKGKKINKRQPAAAITCIRLATGDKVLPVTCYRQYLRVRRPAIFTRAWVATLRPATSDQRRRRELCFLASRNLPFTLSSSKGVTV